MQQKDYTKNIIPKHICNSLWKICKYIKNKLISDYLQMLQEKKENQFLK